MNRRGFLGTMLALGAAPAVVRAESLMRIVVPTTREVMDINRLDTLYGWAATETLLTPTMVTREALFLLDQQLVLPLATRTLGGKVGDTLVIRTPRRYS